MCISATMTFTIQLERFCVFIEQQTKKCCWTVQMGTLATRKISEEVSVNSCLSQDACEPGCSPIQPASECHVWTSPLIPSLSSQESCLALWHMPKWVCQALLGVCESFLVKQEHGWLLAWLEEQWTRTSEHGCDGSLQNTYCIKMTRICFLSRECWCTAKSYRARMFWTAKYSWG